MTVTTQLVDDLINGFDEDVQEVEEKEEKVSQESEEIQNESTEDKADETEEESEDEGYSIDDATDESDTDDTSSEEKQERQDIDRALAALSPEQRYIIQNIQPITVRGRIGDSEEVKEYKAFDPAQLPAGFRYLDDREHDIAAKSFNSLEARATALQNEFRDKADQESSKKFKEANDRADWEDIAYLQKEGELPKFKIKPNEKGFEDDSAAKLIQEVLDFKDERNAKYLKDHNEKGRPFRMIGFEEAFRMYKPKTETASNEQSKEDKERKNLAKRTTKTTGQDSKEATADRVQLRSSRDLSNYIDSLDI